MPLQTLTVALIHQLRTNQIKTYYETDNTIIRHTDMITDADTIHTNTTNTMYRLTTPKIIEAEQN